MPEYKYIDLRKMLIKKKWVLVRTKGSHERWKGPNETLITIPHHKTLRIGLYKVLIKQIQEDENAK